MTNKEYDKLVDDLVRARDSLTRGMLERATDQLAHSWAKWGLAGEIQACIEGLRAMQVRERDL